MHALPRLLPMIDLPISDPIGRGAPEGGDDTIELDALYLDLDPGKRVIVTGRLSEAEGELAGVTFSEARKVLANDLGGVRSIIRLDQALDRQYTRESVVIRGNVALATHGELFQEPIASGEAISSVQANSAQEEAGDLCLGADADRRRHHARGLGR